MNSCKMCNEEIKGSGKIYCSNSCKFKDPEYNRSRSFKGSNPKNKRIRCKETGKIFKDVLNLSGALTRYSKNVLHKEYESDDWEIFEPDIKKTLRCPYCNYETPDINNNSGALSRHCKSVHGKIPKQVIEDFPSYSKYWKLKSKELQRESELSESSVVCRICNEKMKKITNSHLRKHGTTVSEYKKNFGIDNLSSERTRQKMRNLYFENDKLLANNYTSKGELEIKQFLNDIGISTIKSRKDNIEIDIYCPDHSIGIEYNGLYWHSELAGGKDRNYHLDKTEHFERKGVHIIHIFEDEWNLKQDIVKSRLKAIFGKSDEVLYARKCEIREISAKEKNDFLLQNHLQGKDMSTYKLGAYYQEKLVSVMTFRRPNRSMGHRNSESIELSRFCNLKNHTVIGIASKLLKKFIMKYKPSKIISYADRRWTNINSNLYDSIGFKLISKGKPNYWYMKRHDIREYRYNYIKSKLPEKLNRVNQSKTEWQNMSDNGYDRIWDCGSLKFEMCF